MSQVLVLDNAYQIVGHDNFEDAVLKIVLKKARPFPGAKIIAVFRSPSTIIEIPSILMLTVYVNIHKRMTRYGSKRLVFARDNYTCQYCGRHKDKLRHGEFLNIDHVIPKAKFKNPRDVSKWENVTTSCNTCNNKKDKMLPHECNMHPITQPHKPKSVAITVINTLTTEQRKLLQDINMPL